MGEAARRRRAAGAQQPPLLRAPVAPRTVMVSRPDGSHRLYRVTARGHVHEIELLTGRRVFDRKLIDEVMAAYRAVDERELERRARAAGLVLPGED